MGNKYSVLQEVAPTSVVLNTDSTYRPNAKVFTQKSIRHVCIGINYSKTDNSLSGCINDAKMMQDYILDKGSNLGVFLSDDQDPQGVYYPCLSNMTRALKWALSSASVADYENVALNDFPALLPGTLVFITYSGHGYHVRDLNGDEKDGFDEVMCPVARDGNFDAFLVDDAVGQILYARAREDCFCVLITDCCMSGTVADMRFTIQNKGFVEDRNYPLLKAPVVHISGCKDPQSSYEGVVDGKQGGYLTVSLLSVLNQTPKPNLYSLITRVRSKISKHVSSAQQLPQLSCAHKTSVYSIFPL